MSKSNLGFTSLLRSNWDGFLKYSLVNLYLLLISNNSQIKSKASKLKSNKVFMATKNPECLSTAKFTTPVPPEPNSLINS